MSTALKLTAEGIEHQAQVIADGGDRAMGEVQATIVAMIGGGFLANSAITGPAHFYIDARVGALKYPRREILQAVKILARAAELRGVVTAQRQIPDYRTVHLNLGVSW